MGQYVSLSCRCGRRFQVRAARHRWKPVIYCSRRCWRRMVRAPDRRCATCRRQFRRSASQIKSRHVFCSRACHYKGRSRGLVLRVVAKPYRRPPLPPKLCAFCHEPLSTSERPNKYHRGRCIYMARSARMAWSRNPGFKGGRRKKPSDRGPDWPWVRRQVYSRDSWRCRACDKRCGRRTIQCHHIVPYEFTRDNGEDNLVTLCVSCHKRVHERPDEYPSLIRIPAS